MPEPRIEWNNEIWPSLDVRQGQCYAHAQVIELSQRVLYLHDIFVPSGLRKQGMGRQLLETVVKEGVSREADSFAAIPITPEGQQFFVHILAGEEIAVRLGETLYLPLGRLARSLSAAGEAG